MRNSLCTVFATLSFAMSGCGAKAPPVSAPAAKAATETKPTKPRSPRRVEPATGELRRALLALRRVHFAYDSATLSPEARSALAEAGDALRTHPMVEIQIEGHGDERGTGEYNIALGERRARAVADYLSGLGVETARLTPVSYGEERPLDGAHSSLAYARNRRVEFRLARGDVQLTLEEGTPIDDRGRRLPTPAQK